MDLIETQAAQQLITLFDLPGKTEYSPEQIKKVLAEKISELIQHNFEQFIFILYRLDIDEKKVKQLIADHPDDDAAPYIAGLIMDRQLQKARSRATYRAKYSDNNDEEKW